LAGFAGVGAESSSYMYYINNRQQLILNLNLNLKPKEGAAAGQLLWRFISRCFYVYFAFVHMSAVIALR
jgi:hypothetical protein